MSAMTLAILLTLKDLASGPLGKFTDNIQQTSAKLMATGAAARLAGNQILNALKTPITAFAEAEDAATALRVSMMNADGVSNGFEKVNQLATDLGNKLPGNTADFQNMMRTLKEQGVSAADMLGGVGKSAAYLAVQLKMPFSEAAKLAAKVGEAAGVAANDMEGFMDVIQRTANLGVEASEMQYAFGRSAGKLKEVGAQGLETAQSLSVLFAGLIKTGLSGETVGTNFGGLLSALQQFQYGIGDKATAAQKSLKSLGIEMSFFDKQGKFTGPREMIAQLEKLNKLKPDQKAKALNSMFGGGQDAQMVSTMMSGGVKAYDQMQKRMKDQAALNTKVEAQLKTLKNIWDAASGTFTNLLAELGAAIAPELKSLAETFEKISEKLIAFTKNHPQLTKMAMGFTALSGAALVVGGTTLMGAGMILNAANDAVKGYKFIKDKGKAALKTMSGFSDVIPKANTAIKSKAKAMGSAAKSAGSWVKANLLSVSGLKKLAASGWGSISGGFKSMAISIKAASMASVSWVKTNLLTITGLKSLGKAGYAKIVAGFRAIGAAIKAAGYAAVANPVGIVVLAIVAAIALAAVLIYKYWKPIKAFFQGMWSGIKEGLAPLLPAFRAAFAPMAPVLRPIMSALKAVWTWFKNLLNPVDDVGGRAAAMGQKVGLALAKIIGEGIKVLTFFTGMATKFTAFGIQMMTGLLSGITSGAGKVLAKVKEIGSSIKNAFTGLMGIKSPSRVFMGYGNMLGAGLQLGMESSTGGILKAAGKLSKAATPDMPKLASISVSGSAIATPGIARNGLATGAGSGGAMQITFAPVIQLGEGSAKEQVQQALALSFSEFERLMERYQRGKQRRGATV